MPAIANIVMNQSVMSIQFIFFFAIQGSPDLKAAREVANYLQTRHHEFHFTVQVMTVFET